MPGIVKRLGVAVFAVFLCSGVQAQDREIGAWGISLDIDPMTDQNSSAMWAPAWDNPTIGFDEAVGVLFIRCGPYNIDVFFALDLERRLLESDTYMDATFRIDKGPVQTSSGYSSSNGGAYFFDDAEIPKLFRDLQGASNFVFRIQDKDGSMRTYQTRVNGFAEAYAYSTISSCPSN